MVGQHEATDSVCRLDVRRLPRQCNLDASWTPGYELGKLPLSDALQALVYLSGIYLSLDDVQDGDVAVVVPAVTWCRHHHIFWLKQEG